MVNSLAYEGTRGHAGLGRIVRRSAKFLVGLNPLIGWYSLFMALPSVPSKSPEEYVSSGRHIGGAVGIVTLAIAAAVTGVLDAFGDLTAVVPYVGTIYPGVAFQAIFGLWFGPWGALGTYVGTVISGLVTGMPLPVALIFKTSNFLQSFIAFASFYYLLGNAGLTRRRDMVLYVVFVLILSNLVGGIVGVTSIWYFFHVPARVMFTVGYADWVISNIIVEVVLGIPVLRVVTSYVRNTRLFYGSKVT